MGEVRSLPLVGEGDQQIGRGRIRGRGELFGSDRCRGEGSGGLKTREIDSDWNEEKKRRKRNFKATK